MRRKSVIVARVPYADRGSGGHTEAIDAPRGLRPGAGVALRRGVRAARGEGQVWTRAASGEVNAAPSLGELPWPRPRSGFVSKLEEPEGTSSTGVATIPGHEKGTVHGGGRHRQPQIEPA